MNRGHRCRANSRRRKCSYCDQRPYHENVYKSNPSYGSSPGVQQYHSSDFSQYYQYGQSPVDTLVGVIPRWEPVQEQNPRSHNTRESHSKHSCDCKRPTTVQVETEYLDSSDQHACNSENSKRVIRSRQPSRHISVSRVVREPEVFHHPRSRVQSGASRRYATYVSMPNMSPQESINSQHVQHEPIPPCSCGMEYMQEALFRPCPYSYNSHVMYQSPQAQPRCSVYNMPYNYGYNCCGAGKCWSSYCPRCVNGGLPSYGNGCAGVPCPMYHM